MSKKLAGKVAVITGAASGIDQAIAKLYAQAGAKVLIADYNLAGAEEVSDYITANGGTATAMQIDVSQLADTEKMIDEAVITYGRIDILVNNAGIMDGFEPVGEITDEKWDHIFDVNTKGVMRAMRKAINYWLERDQAGNIINVISTGGLNGAHAGVAYCASKHAVVALTKNTAFMYAPNNVRVNGIAPGAVATNIGSTIHEASELGAARSKLTHALIPAVGAPEDIGHLALFLASDAAQFVNGTIVTIDGGWTAAF